MRLIAVLSLLLVGRFATPSCAAEPAKPPAPGPSIAELIDHLGSKDFRVRENASKAILALGKDALPELQKGRSHLNAEVRRRLDDLIPPLERALTLTPRRVTLHVVNKPIQEVINELAKQTGFKIMLTNNGGGPQAGPVAEQMIMVGPGVMMAGGGMSAPAAPAAPAPGSQGKTLYTFHFDKAPFWEVFDQLSEQCGLVFQYGYSGDDTLRVQAQDSYVPFSCTSGPFKIVATGFSYNKSNNFGQVQRTPYQPGQQSWEYLSLGLSIAAEPRLPILKLGPVQLRCAEDDEKHSMLATNNENYYFGPWGMMWRSGYGGWNRSIVQQTQVNLVWPSKNCRTVKVLKGVIPVTILADQRPLLVTDKLLTSKGKKFKAGPATFTIDDVTTMAGGKQHQIKISVTEDTKDGAEDYSRIQSLQQRLEVQDDKGNKHQFYFNVFNWGGPTSAQIQITIQPPGPKLGPPTRLIYYSWILMEHEAEFEFKGLPLP
jgi:hypothetical protein